MTAIFLRLLGALIGVFVASAVLLHTVLPIPCEVGVTIYVLWFLYEGWLIVLIAYGLGFTIGFLAFLPMVRTFGVHVLGKPNYWLDQD